MVLRAIMSEFKFACPVCGQHITADSATSGTQLDCPTCFQGLLVPQAPASGDSKLIVTAALVGKPRPVQNDALWQDAAPVPARRMSLLAFALSAIAVLAAGATLFTYREPLMRLVSRRTVARPTRTPPPRLQAKPPRTVYPIPTNISWTLSLTNAVIPNAPAVGVVHGSGFSCERATLLGGILTLRQGHSWPPDLGITVQLYARQGEELSGKIVEVVQERADAPKIVLRWRDEQDFDRTRNFTSGYALKVIFGLASNAHMPGKIFLSLPDDEKSVVAGTFDAEIRRAPPPKPHPPNPQKPNA